MNTENHKKQFEFVEPIMLWFDGACEPVNPNGNMGMGCRIVDCKTKEDLLLYSECIKFGEKGFYQTSNNVAEYLALKEGLEFLLHKNLENRKVCCFGDSKMVIMQMSRKWKIKKGIYSKTAKESIELLTKFTDIEFEWIPRNLNFRADQLSKAPMKERGVEFRLQKD